MWQMERELAAELGLKGPHSHIEMRRRLPIARPDVDWIERPKTRADCEGGPRPCPFAACEFNLLVEVDETNGHLHFPFGTSDVTAIPESCWADIADRGGLTLEEVGRAVGVTRERTRQIEERGLRKLNRDEGAELGLPPERGDNLAGAGWKWRRNGAP